MLKRVESSSSVDLHKHGEAHEPAPAQSHGPDYGAWIFMLTVVLSLIAIALLARNIFAAAQHLESAKRNAETVVRTLSEVGAKRKAGQPEVAACHASAEDPTKLPWAPCWEEIIKLPDVVKLVNPMVASNAVFGPPCDGSDASIGRIAIEKGTPWSSAGNTGTTFAAIVDDDSIATETPLRVQVCNRWGEAVKVQEIKF
jgi:hypothetical protein